MKLYAATHSSNMIGYYNFNDAFTDKVAQSEHSELVYDKMIPLKIWFGFCDDYKKLIMNSRHELILTRSQSSLNCLYDGLSTATSTAVKITVNKLEWKMPYITLADKVKMDTQKLISKNKKINVFNRK